MARIILQCTPFLTALLCLGIAQAEPANQEPSSKKPTNPALKQIPDVPGKLRILLIGDSISMGYTLPVRESLKDRANVHHPPENCGDTARGLANLDAWLGEKPWDVIHFNFGLHDLKYLDPAGTYVPPAKGKVVATPDAYAANLRALVARLKRTGSKLVFATTTPVPPGTLGRIPDDDRRYNAVAVAVMQESGVTINDLGSYVREIQAKLPPLPVKPNVRPLPQREGDPQLPYNVHFTHEGSKLLAEKVTASILRNLP